MTESDYFERFICKYIPLDKVIGENEKILWSSTPAKDIISRIFYNDTKIQRLVILIFFIIVQIIFLWISLPSLIKAFNIAFLIFFLIFISLSTIATVYLANTILQLKASAFISPNWYSEYILTNKKLYLKLTRLIYPQGDRPTTCKIHIINLQLIQAIKFYRSFWDRHYKETASFKIKLSSPYHSIAMHNLSEPEEFMSIISKLLDSLHNKNDRT